MLRPGVRCVQHRQSEPQSMLPSSFPYSMSFFSPTMMLISRCDGLAYILAPTGGGPSSSFACCAFRSSSVLDTIANSVIYDGWIVAGHL